MASGERVRIEQGERSPFGLPGVYGADLEFMRGEFQVRKESRWRFVFIARDVVQAVAVVAGAKVADGAAGRMQALKDLVTLRQLRANIGLVRAALRLLRQEKRKSLSADKEIGGKRKSLSAEGEIGGKRRLRSADINLGGKRRKQ